MKTKKELCILAAMIGVLTVIVYGLWFYRISNPVDYSSIHPGLGWGQMFEFIGQVAYSGLVWFLLGLIQLSVLGVTVYLAIKRAPIGAFLLLWVPALAVYAFDHVYNPRSLGDDNGRYDIHEVHINLSGKTFWLDKSTTVNGLGVDSDTSYIDNGMLASQPEKFLEITRYATDYYGHDPMLAYQDAHLSATFQTMPVFSTPQYRDGDAKTTPMIKRVIQPNIYPDVLKILKKKKIEWAEDEADLLIYQYYHYPDRVEVVPALYNVQIDALGKDDTVAFFHFANLHEKPIVRLEIDGEAVYLGAGGITPENGEDCRSRNWSASVMNTLKNPLKIRWQFAEVNAEWHEAIVTVPNFSSEKIKGEVRDYSATLYFQPDGHVLAERGLVVNFNQNKTGIRSTGLPALAITPPCGAFKDQWTVDEILD